MLRKSFLSFFFIFCCLAMAAQGKYTLKGLVVDHETGDAVVGATVQLFNASNKAFVAGVAADADGKFVFSNVDKKKYSLQITSIGYVTKTVELNMSEKKGNTIDLGYMTLNSDERMLSEITVTANAAKVQASGDSLVYNASAYRTPEGSTLEALVKLLPGAEVDDNGNITINGKTVSKILVDGKEFFLNDKDVAMKNIPVDMIEKLKTYERKSDQARITGIDDGEEETVLDLSVKKGMKNGWFGNLNAVAGTEHRYDSRAMVNRFNDNVQISALANARNTPDRWGWNRANGLNARKEIGGNFATTSDKLETGGSVRYNFNGADRLTESSSENFAAKKGKFNMNKSQAYTSNSGFYANAKIEWKPDTLTNILIRPNFSYSRNRGINSNTSASYDKDPNEVSDKALNYNDAIEKYAQDPDQVNVDEVVEDLLDIVVNTNTSRSQSFSTNTNLNGELQINRKLSSKGRNITLRANGGYQEGENKQLSAASINIYNSGDVSSSQKNNRYYNTPSTSYNMMGMLLYNEPIADRTYIQLGYRYRYSYSKNDRKAEIYESDAYESLRNALKDNPYDIDAILNFMGQTSYKLIEDEKLSQFSEYRHYNQNVSVQFRRVRQNYNFSAGLDFQPERSVLNYKYMGTEYPEVTRNVFNIAPRVNLKYNFDKTTNLQFRYRGRSTQPSMTNLLEIRDDSDPLNISMGNSKLKPSFSHSFNGDFHTYNAEAQRGIWSWVNGEMTNNSISNKTTYDPETGVRTTKPMNINGNWRVGGGMGLNTAIDEKKLFSVGGHLGGNYSNNVGFYNNSKNPDTDTTVKSITKNSSVNFGLNTNYRNTWLNVELRGRINYAHIDNNVNVSANQNTYNYSYGTEIQVTLPWGTELNTDCNMSSRRGYSASEMNTNELLWNASISHSFLKGKALMLKAEIFDILGQQTNISRTVNAFTRSDSRNNAIYQYAMFSAIFKFSVFAGKNTMGTDQEKGNNDRRWRR